MSNRINRIATLIGLQNVPVPTQTTTYKPITHTELDTLIKEALIRNNFILTNSTYLMARDGKEAVGKYNINYGDDSDIGLMVVWQNSYDKVVTVKLAIGGNVFVCSNGVVVGDMGAYKHKHNGDVQEITPATIDEFIKSAATVFEQLVKDKNHMKTILSSMREFSELLGRMYIEENIITANQLSTVKRELYKPSFDYNAPVESVWNLMNCITLALKEAHPKNWLEQHINVYKFLVKHFNI